MPTPLPPTSVWEHRAVRQWQGSLETPGTRESSCLPKWCILDVLSPCYPEGHEVLLRGAFLFRKRQAQSSWEEAGSLGFRTSSATENVSGMVSSPLWPLIPNLKISGIGLDHSFPAVMP